MAHSPSPPYLSLSLQILLLTFSLLSLTLSVPYTSIFLPINDSIRSSPSPLYLFTPTAATLPNYPKASPLQLSFTPSLSVIITPPFFLQNPSLLRTFSMAPRRSNKQDRGSSPTPDLQYTLNSDEIDEDEERSSVQKGMTCIHPAIIRRSQITSSSTQVNLCNTQNILSDFMNCLSSPLFYEMISKDREIYKYIQLMNVRQQHFHLHTITYIAIMAFPTRSALDTILRNESNSVRFQATSTPSLSNALQLTLAGKLLASKKPSISNMILFASRTWECPNRLMCYDHGNGIYSFEFINLLDVERVMSGGPWYINGDLLLVDRMDPKLSIEQLPFSETKLWIRCYDLPPMCFNLEFATLIDNGIGKFSDTDLPPEDPSQAAISIRRVPSVRKYLRVKVTHNLYSPIKRSQLVEIENPDTHLIEELTSRLAYERLPTICNRCGFLGHTIDSCSFSGPTLFGDWIRAEKFYRVGGPDKLPNQQVSSPNHPAHDEVGIGSRVSEMADLITRPDPSIFQVNFKDVRSSGKLPPITSKGKQSLIEFPHPSTVETGMIPYAECSSRPGSALIHMGSTSSLLGAYPSQSVKPPRLNPEVNDDTIVIDREDGNLASYFNPSVPHGDLFSPTTNRCLFRSELVHPAFSTNMKNIEISPKLPGPIPKELPLLDTSMSFTKC